MPTQPTPIPKKTDVPEGVWDRCQACGEMLYTREFEELLRVCQACDHHHRHAPLIMLRAIATRIFNIRVCRPIGSWELVDVRVMRGLAASSSEIYPMYRPVSKTNSRILRFSDLSTRTDCDAGAVCPRAIFELGQPFSLAAKIDDSADLGAEVFSQNDAIDESLFEQEFGGLESFGQFLFDGIGDHTRPREADHGSRFRNDDVAEHREAGSDAGGGRVGQYGDVQPAGFIELAQQRRGLGHLHQGNHAFLHSCPAGSSYQHQREISIHGPFDRGGHFLAHHRTHAGHDERRIHHAQDHPPGP